MSQVLALLKQPRSHEWETPPELFEALRREFQFRLDAAATSENTLCETFYAVDDDGLDLDWSWAGSIYCNPPYGTQIGRWVAKGYDEAQKGCTVVMLIPARTDTAYWHNFVMRAAEIRLIRHRLRFSGLRVNAPFPSAVVVFSAGFHYPRVSAINRTGVSQ